jgi:hypothetical protein
LDLGLGRVLFAIALQTNRTLAQPVAFGKASNLGCPHLKKIDERQAGKRKEDALSQCNAIRLLVAAMAMLALTSVLPVPATAQVSIGISVGFPPPELPVYVQPICPGEGYIWTPGYWAWDPDYEDYYWVPGTWVLDPSPAAAPPNTIAVSFRVP